MGAGDSPAQPTSRLLLIAYRLLPNEPMRPRRAEIFGLLAIGLLLLLFTLARSWHLIRWSWR